MDLIDKIIKFEREFWPEGNRATRENIESRLNIFPEGVFSLTDDSENIIAFSSSMILMSQDVYNSDSWNEVTDNGNIKNHESHGNTLFIVDVCVQPELRRKGLGRKIMQQQLDLASSLDLTYVILASRIPDFHNYNGNIYHYLSKTKNDLSIDSMLCFYQKMGFKIDGIIPNYRENDEESRDYGVLMYKEINGETKGTKKREKFRD